MKTRARAKTRNKLAYLAGVLLFASENKTRSTMDSLVSKKEWTQKSIIIELPSAIISIWVHCELSSPVDLLAPCKNTLNS